MLNALTIDVEDYFHVTAFKKHICADNWDSYPLRVVNNTLQLLDILEKFSVKATFFILGWVAERSPSLVNEIHLRGHEIACHGYGHELVYEIGPKKFRADVKKAKNIIENICGNKINGYRAPSYSITKDSLWAFDILIEEGFSYDSSIFPIFHDIYGIPHANRFPHEIKSEAGAIKEFPMSTIQINFLAHKFTIPVAGGGYLRLFPVWFIKKAIQSLNSREGKPAVLYFHPWEIDHEQPRIKAGLKSTFRHYVNLKKNPDKIRTLLSSFDFTTMGQTLGVS
ncbi:MAG: XrtA system polysaccharide deacetylase [Nitrospirota bacterium]